MVRAAAARRSSSPSVKTLEPPGQQPFADHVQQDTKVRGTEVPRLRERSQQVSPVGDRVGTTPVLDVSAEIVLRQEPVQGPVGPVKNDTGRSQLCDVVARDAAGKDPGGGTATEDRVVLGLPEPGLQPAHDGVAKSDHASRHRRRLTAMSRAQ